MLVRKENRIINRRRYSKESVSIDTYGWKKLELSESASRDITISGNKMIITVRNANWEGLFFDFHHHEVEVWPTNRSSSVVVITCKLSRDNKEAAHLLKEESKDTWVDLSSFDVASRDVKISMDDGVVTITANDVYRECVTIRGNDVEEDFDIESVSFTGDWDLDLDEFLPYNGQYDD